MSRSSSGRALRALMPMLLACPALASAHVKWFARFDLQGEPRSPFEVMTSPSFLALALAAALALGLGGALDAWLTRRARAGVGVDLGDRAVAAMRFGLAACFVASILFFRDAPVILTPDLHTASAWTVLVQWGIVVAAVTGFLRVAAAGVGVLFVQAVADYGPFHLMDYTVFVGIAAFLLLAGGGERSRTRGLVLLRLSLGFTLMWGGIEKWLYPEWTYPLLCGSGKALLMGLSPDFFMQAAGFVEFCLAFVAVVGATAARVACALLALLMTAAIPMFGGVDAVGHAPFLLVLAVLAASRNPLADRFGDAAPVRQALQWAAAFAAVLGILPAFYFAAHRAFYGHLATGQGLPVTTGLAHPVTVGMTIATAILVSVAVLAHLAGRAGRTPSRA
jgi:hypothetical protein